MLKGKAFVFGSALLLTGALGVLPPSAHANKGQCSQPFTIGSDPSPSDCLYILQTAVGTRTCDNPCICKPAGGSGPVRASDALVCLNRSVNPAQAINCPCANLRGPQYAFNPATDVTNANIVSKYTATDYIGAFPQGDGINAGDWTAGWTIELHGNHTVWHPATAGTLNGATPSANGQCPTGTTLVGNTALPGGFQGAMDICQLDAHYTSAATINLTNDNIYYLGGSNFQGTRVGDGDAAGKTPGTVVQVVINMEPGTLMLGGAAEAFAITRGSKLNVNGTAANPVVMGSQDWFASWLAGGDGTSGTQEWGGLVLAGFAANNLPGGEGLAEGFLTPLYFGGGASPVNSDSSGSIHYLIIRNAGFDLDGNGSELNGLTNYSLGYGTTIDYVQVHRNFDDNYEWFGGQVVETHIVGTDGNDDNIDTDNGFQGGVQFAVMRQVDGLGDKGFEADNDATGSANTPKSQPTVVNVTHLGSDGAGGPVSGYEHTGLHLRRNTGYFLWNDITQNNAVACLRPQNVFNNAGVLSDPDDGTLQIHNFIAYCPTASQGVYATSGAEPVGDIQTWYTADPNNRTIDPTLNSFGYPGDPDND